MKILLKRREHGETVPRGVTVGNILTPGKHMHISKLYSLKKQCLDVSVIKYANIRRCSVGEFSQWDTQSGRMKGRSKC